VSAVLHRHAVTTAARSRPRRSARRRPEPVTVTRVHPAVWQAALRLAGRDPRRLLVASPSQVIVLNRARRGPEPVDAARAP
jgi:hypothetical protein